MKLAIVLFNLGGPDSLDAVQPFLQNLFSDPAIISLPGFVRRPLAKFIASRRAPLAKTIYAHMGGRSTILPETENQARALESALKEHGHEARCFIAMRYWRPFTEEAVKAVKAFAPERLVLLPLYPQYSTTTTRSSVMEWRKEAARQGVRAPEHQVCCYPFEEGFVATLAALTAKALTESKPGLSYRVLFSAHGLPKRVVERGDPYQWQVERTVEAVVARLKGSPLDWQICYQSRVGPLEWIGPATDAEVRRAGADGKGLIVVPVAFVSEHSETLVELDIEYRRLAEESGVPHYIRAPTAGTHPSFIGGLAGMVIKALTFEVPVTCALSQSARWAGFAVRTTRAPMLNALDPFYLWIKAFHIVAVIAWMAGMLYLPRLYYYHCEVRPGTPESERFKTMERRLLKIIVNPAMVAVWLLGLTLAFTPASGGPHQGWLMAKFLLVLLLSGAHGLFARWRKDFAIDRNRYSKRVYAAFNEVPAVLMIGIVILVVVKPF